MPMRAPRCSAGSYASRGKCGSLALLMRYSGSLLPESFLLIGSERTSAFKRIGCLNDLGHESDTRGRHVG
jgi:hypothetical protein